MKSGFCYYSFRIYRAAWVSKTGGDQIQNSRYLSSGLGAGVLRKLRGKNWGHRLVVTLMKPVWSALSSALSTQQYSEHSAVLSSALRSRVSYKIMIISPFKENWVLFLNPIHPSRSSSNATSLHKPSMIEPRWNFLFTPLSRYFILTSLITTFNFLWSKLHTCLYSHI